jgi:hypothetical protein
MAGGSAASSRYIWYSEVPGGVFSTHGSSLVPLPLKFATSVASPRLSLLQNASGEAISTGARGASQSSNRSAARLAVIAKAVVSWATASEMAPASSACSSIARRSASG